MNSNKITEKNILKYVEFLSKCDIEKLDSLQSSLNTIIEKYKLVLKDGKAGNKLFTKTKKIHSEEILSTPGYTLDTLEELARLLELDISKAKFEKKAITIPINRSGELMNVEFSSVKYKNLCFIKAKDIDYKTSQDVKGLTKYSITTPFGLRLMYVYGFHQVRLCIYILENIGIDWSSSSKEFINYIYEEPDSPLVILLDLMRCICGDLQNYYR